MVVILHNLVTEGEFFKRMKDHKLPNYQKKCWGQLHEKAAHFLQPSLPETKYQSPNRSVFEA